MTDTDYENLNTGRPQFLNSASCTWETDSGNNRTIHTWASFSVSWLLDNKAGYVYMRSGACVHTAPGGGGGGGTVVYASQYKASIYYTRS